MNPVVLHIPHSSVIVPEEFRGDFTADTDQAVAAMTDIYTDELFGTGPDSLVFSVSRVVCDPERFRNDALEVMATRGMGAVYTRDHSGTEIRRVTPERREEILKRWYDPHHDALERMTARRLERFGICLIVDCHSFPDVPLPYESVPEKGKRADFCVGTDGFHN